MAKKPRSAIRIKLRALCSAGFPLWAVLTVASSAGAQERISLWPDRVTTNAFASAESRSANPIGTGERRMNPIVSGLLAGAAVGGLVGAIIGMDTVAHTDYTDHRYDGFLVFSYTAVGVGIGGGIGLLLGFASGT